MAESIQDTHERDKADYKRYFAEMQTQFQQQQQQMQAQFQQQHQQMQTHFQQQHQQIEERQEKIERKQKMAEDVSCTWLVNCISAFITLFVQNDKEQQRMVMDMVSLT